MKCSFSTTRATPTDPIQLRDSKMLAIENRNWRSNDVDRKWAREREKKKELRLLWTITLQRQTKRCLGGHSGVIVNFIQMYSVSRCLAFISPEIHSLPHTYTQIHWSAEKRPSYILFISCVSKVPLRFQSNRSSIFFLLFLFHRLCGVSLFVYNQTGHRNKISEKKAKKKIEQMFGTIIV